MGRKAFGWKGAVLPALALALCAGLAGLLLSGCGQGRAAKQKTMKIGVTLYDQYDTFISHLMDTFKEDVYQLSQESGETISLEVMDAAKSQSTQNDQVKMMIERGCDVICVNLVDRTEPTTITDMAEKSGVPIIFFNRELVPEDLERWDRLYYVGADAIQSGVLEGEIAADAFLHENETDRNGDGVWQYVSLEGETGHQDAIVRTEHSINTIMDAGIEVEKLGYAIANWNRAQAKTQFTAMWTEFGDRIELVLPNNDDMALGTIDALKTLGVPREDWPVIVGIDGTSEGLEAVRAGEMIGTVYNDKEGQAGGMLDLAHTIVTGGDLSQTGLQDGKYIRLPYEKITAENVDDYS